MKSFKHSYWFYIAASVFFFIIVAMSFSFREPDLESINSNKKIVSTDFEICASTYAWELHNETPTVVFDNLQNIAGINSAYLIALMHGSQRPKNINQYPHDPVFEKWKAEDACIYWHPDESLYGRLKPSLSKHSFLNSTDWLKNFCQESRKRGLKTGAEISHYIIPKEVLQQPENQDLCQRDLLGNPVYILCPNHPEGHKYIMGLFADLAKNYDLDFIQTCYLPLWDKSGDPSGGSSCFCEFCRRKALQEGFDLEAAIPFLKENPKAEPYFSQWLSFHNSTLINLIKDIDQTIHQYNPNVEFRYNHHSTQMDWGRIIDKVAPFFQSIRISAYQEEANSTDKILNEKIPWINRVKEQVGADKPVISAVAIRPGATPEIIYFSVRNILENGIYGFSLGHYESAPFSYIRAFQKSIFESGLSNANETKIIEAESQMKIVGFQPDEHIFEKGIKTTTEGRASYRFSEKSDLYNLGVFYSGDSAIFKVRLNGDIVDSWQSVSTTACWQSRYLKQVELNKNDLLSIEVNANGSSKALLDCISISKSTN